MDPEIFAPEILASDTAPGTGDSRMIEFVRAGGLMVEAQVTWTDGERFLGSASSGHAMVVDSDRKRNTATGPMELVLIGLCACTATDVVNILTKKRERFSGVHVRAEAERATEPPTVYKSIKLIYTISGQVSHKAAEDAVRLSEEKYCGVSAMLKCTARITSEIHFLESAENTREVAKN